MKKFIIAVLAAVCTACLALAVACKEDKEPEYYILSFAKTQGVTYVCDIPSGYEVREGVTVSFSISYADNVKGEKTVKANDDELTADENGNYSFSMSEDTTVSVEGTFILNSYDVTFYNVTKNAQGQIVDEYWVDYLDEDGNPFETEKGYTYEANEQIKFKLDVSVYYERDYDKYPKDAKPTVIANTQILTPDKNGVYTLNVIENTNVTVSGFVNEENFTERENCGTGTESDPYIISRPVDLFMLSNLVKSDKHRLLFYDKHYKISDDVEEIDMEGEQLFIIGESEATFFAGTFDGNGKTIKNYYISDTFINQSTYTPDFMPYIGLFGFVAATTSAVPEIYNLHLSDFTIDVDAASAPSEEKGFYVGSLVGVGFGVNITGCTAKGKITADADDNYFGYMGGLIGAQYSAFGGSGSSATRVFSIVKSCSTDVELRGESGYVYTAGGISGLVSANEERTAASVINCYSTADILGAMYSGGIAGRLSPFCSLQNCYSTGYVEATNYIGRRDGNEDLGYAYGGGIVGYADYNSVVDSCFAVGDVNAYSVADGQGGDFSFEGKIYGGKDEAGVAFIETQPAYVLNCYSENIKDVLKDNLLGWDKEDWNLFDPERPSGYPILNMEETSKSFTLKINLGGKSHGGSTELSVPIKDAYYPVSYWYAVGDIDFRTVAADDGNRSYGYFFDAELTRRVPYSYIPMKNTVLYAGFADFNEVAGEYYLQGLGGYLELAADGTLIYRNGAINSTSYYTYDKDKVLVLYDTLLGIVSGGAETYYSFEAKVEDGVLKIYDNEIYPENTPLTALKKSATFNYGSYYAGNVTYTFNANGSGTMVKVTGSGSSLVKFDYDLHESNYGNGLYLGGSIYFDVDSVFCSGDVDANGNVTKINGTPVYRMDAFEGVWEKSAGSHKQYTFDGKGAWSYEYFGYKNGTKQIISSDKGAYTQNPEGSIALKDGLRASFTPEGYLVIDGEIYYRENSFVGEWNFFHKDYPVELNLGGIGADGVGTATVDFGSGYKMENADRITYVAEKAANGKVTLMLYLFDQPMGELIYSADENTLSGSFYRFSSNAIVDGVTFYLYDDFKGEWISDDGDLSLVEFNGLGNYDIDGDNNLAVRGSVKIGGEAVGTYTLVNSTLEGYFVYNEVKYNISFNDATGKIEVTYGEGNSVTLEKYDIMYGTDLVDDDGNVYVFDGRGNLASGGKLTIKGATETVISYTFDTDGKTVKVGDSGDTIALDTAKDAYVYTTGGTTKNLTLNNDFTGKWLVVGAQSADKYLEIGKISASYKAEGKQFGEAVSFTYHPDGNYLTFTDIATEIRVDVVKSEGASELSISFTTIQGTASSVAVSEDNYDSYRGRWTAADGSYIELDGLGKASLVSGTMNFYGKDGKLTQSISYRITPLSKYTEYGDYFASLEMIETTRGTLFTECDKADEGAYTLGSVSRKFVTPELYLVEAFKKGDNNVKYIFDGLGTIYCTDGSTLSYTVDGDNGVKMEQYLTVTDGNDKFKAVLDYGLRDFTLVMEPIVFDDFKGKWDGADGTYIELDGLGLLGIINGSAIVYKSATDPEEEDTVIASYEYSIEESVAGGGATVVELYVNKNVYLFMECGKDDEGAFTLGGKSYKIVTPQFYRMQATDYNDVVFTFDGIGKAYTSDGKIYAYKYESNDTLNKEYIFTFTDSYGKTQKVLVNYSKANSYTLEFEE